MIEVGIVIVNYKMKAFVRDCLTTLFKDIADAPFSVKVAVVDNGSGDEVGEMLAKEFPQVLFLQNGKNLGYGGAVNNGIRAMEAEYYFVYNPDTKIVEPKTIERLRQFMIDNPKAGMCAPKQVSFEGKLLDTAYRFHSFLIPPYRRTILGKLSRGKRALNRFLMHDWDHSSDRLVDWILGSAMFVRGSVMRQVGLMDERFFLYFEDTDWCRRFWLAGAPVYYVSSVTIMHAHRRQSAGMSVWRGFFMNKSTRYHVASWIKYLWKYGVRSF